MIEVAEASPAPATNPSPATPAHHDQTEQQPAKRIKAPPFTRETARMNSLKRWDAWRAAKDAPRIAAEAQAASQPAAGKDAYSTERLRRVRAQLDRIDAMMLDEDDPQKLDRLASAQAKLSEQERIYRGEPLPGSRRPAAEAVNRKPSLFGAVPSADQTPQGNAGQEQE